MRQCGVAVLGKGATIPCGLRLALAHLGGSEIHKIRWSGVLVQRCMMAPRYRGGHQNRDDPVAFCTETALGLSLIN